MAEHASIGIHSFYCAVLSMFFLQDIKATNNHRIGKFEMIPLVLMHIFYSTQVLSVNVFISILICITFI